MSVPTQYLTGDKKAIEEFLARFDVSSGLKYLETWANLEPDLYLRLRWCV